LLFVKYWVAKHYPHVKIETSAVQGQRSLFSLLLAIYKIQTARQDGIVPGKKEGAIAGPFSFFALGICLSAGMLPEASNSY
jgi:hypothetical protein